MRRPRRFARTVCLAALDEPSTFTLARTSRNGIDAYINVVVAAMTRQPTPPAVAAPTTTLTAMRAVRIPPDGEPPDIPDPPDPTDPRPPRPPFPPEGWEVDSEEAQRIVTLVGNLDQPLPTCPGAARLASFRAALTTLSQLATTRLEAAMYSALDLCNHRVDAWVTSLASRRLAALRATTPRGVVIGGWGCLQDVRPANTQDPDQRAEFIHAPSLDHAAAAAVLRSAARRASAAGSDHAEIDLSSRRVRLARWVLDGVRNGRSLSELLGARFERALKGTTGERALGALRAAFPGKSGAAVVDGLKLLQTGAPAASDPAVAQAAQALDDTIDALTDALTAESVFQIVKGNPAGALIDVDAIANGQAPPALRVTETPASGTRLTHRLAITIPTGAKAPGWTTSPTPRAKAEPLLDAWCGFVLGPAAKTLLIVEGSNGINLSLSLAALGVAAIDVMFAGRDDAGELEERLVLAARQTNPAIAGAAVRRDRAWKDLVGLCTTMARTVALAQPLRPAALEAPDALATLSDEDFGDLRARAIEGTDRLTALRTALAARPADASAAVRTAAAFGIRVPGALLAAVPDPRDLDAMLTTADARLATAAAATTPRERLRALFGGDLPGLVTFTPRDPASLTTTALPPTASLLGGDAIAPIAWLDAIGRTRPAAARLAELLQRIDIAGSASPSTLRIAQAPYTDGDKWIATSFVDKGGKRSNGRLSVVIHSPAGFSPTQALGGLLLDAWTETIPYEKRDTAMALRYNSPGTRAPQAILLAVHPDPSRAWTSDTLVSVLAETLQLTRMRMQPPTTFSRGGQLPLTWLGQRANGAGISFTL